MLCYATTHYISPCNHVCLNDHAYLHRSQWTVVLSLQWLWSDMDFVNWVRALLAPWVTRTSQSAAVHTEWQCVVNSILSVEYVHTSNSVSPIFEPNTKQTKTPSLSWLCLLYYDWWFQWSFSYWTCYWCKHAYYWHTDLLSYYRLHPATIVDGHCKARGKN